MVPEAPPLAGALPDTCLLGDEGGRGGRWHPTPTLAAQAVGLCLSHSTPLLSLPQIVCERLAAAVRRQNFIYKKQQRLAHCARSSEPVTPLRAPDCPQVSRRLMGTQGPRWLRERLPRAVSRTAVASGAQSGEGHRQRSTPATVKSERWRQRGDGAWLPWSVRRTREKGALEQRPLEGNKLPQRKGRGSGWREAASGTRGGCTEGPGILVPDEAGGVTSSQAHSLGPREGLGCEPKLC